jgi:ribosomal-protein-serine acetyltransferase
VARRLPRVIEEDAFVVRLWRPDDAKALHEAVVESTEHLRPWMDWIAQEPMTISQRHALISEWEHGWERGEAVPMGIFWEGAVVGGSGYVNPKEHSLEIGYWVHVRHLRQGHALRAARLLTSAAFALPEIDRVEIHHDKANSRSAGVPRRLGYRFVEEKPDKIQAPGQIGIDCLWLITRQEWVESFGQAP